MGKSILTGQDLKTILFPNDAAKSTAVNIIRKYGKHQPKEELITAIQSVLKTPEQFMEDEVWHTLAKSIAGRVAMKSEYEFHQLMNTGSFNVFGRRHIQSNAMQQMEAAMKLPISLRGALMPDAHHGFGLPIGGVLATANEIIPYAVGMDIGCRMALSIYSQPDHFAERKTYDIKKALEKHTHFGNEGGLLYDQEHEVMDSPLFESTDMLRRLKGKAWEQLGTSGTGNHFVEFGTVHLEEGNSLGLQAGGYLGLLTHSGSRGMGAAIAGYYTKVARERCKLPPQVQGLAWLSMDESAGQEYWLSMQLAGDYAKACHDLIHQNLERVLGLDPVLKVENHHNFAWKEIHDGREMIVHRKGATPAGKNELGIIPGSMASAAYVVKGKGNEASLCSASHGAGRKMSRGDARSTLTKYGLHQLLQEKRITLIGGSQEESPMAYKDIESIMQYHDELVQVEGCFHPKIVRMNKS